MIRPYLAGLTRSELAVVMVSGMGLVSGGILGAYLAAGCSIGDLLTAILMSFPATIYLIKMVIPKTGIQQTLGSVHVSDERVDDNLLDAAARGTRGGLMLPVNVASCRLAKARRLTAGRVYSVGDFWKRLAEGVSAFGSDSHPDEQTSAKITKRYGNVAMDANPPRP